MRLSCPARAEGAEITCPLVPLAEDGRKKEGFQKDGLTASEVPSKASCPKVCQQHIVTLKNTAATPLSPAMQCSRTVPTKVPET